MNDSMTRMRSIVVQAATILIFIGLICDLSLMYFANFDYGPVEPYLLLISVMLLVLILVRFLTISKPQVCF